MHKPFRGFTCTLAVLFVSYVIFGFCSPDGFRNIAGKPHASVLIVEASVIALVFPFVVLFVIVWPQTLFANWLVRRFRFHSFLPYALFFAVSSIIVGPFIFLDCLCGHWVLKWLVLATFLFVPCSILWLISFRHEPVA